MPALYDHDESIVADYYRMLGRLLNPQDSMIASTKIILIIN